MTPRIHKTTITHLAMESMPKLRMPPTPKDSALLRAHKPPVHFYRYLYHAIGRQYVWVDLKRISDEQLAATIHDPAVEIYILLKGGVPAGFAELDFRTPPEGKLAYMGLMPEFIGQGLGKFLLIQAIRIAWSHPLEKLTVHTCTKDHPRALPLYQKYGFTPVGQEASELEEINAEISD